MEIKEVKTDSRILAKHTTNPNKDQKKLTFYFKYKEVGFFGCKKEKKIKAIANSDLLHMTEYTDKDKHITNEVLFKSIEGSCILNVCLYQQQLVDKNSLVIAYINNTKETKVNYLRLYCENRFECERYSIRLKEIYCKSLDVLLKNTALSENEHQISTINIETGIGKLFYNQKAVFLKISLLEEIIRQNKLNMKFLFFKIIQYKASNKNQDNKIPDDEVNRI